MLFFIFGIHKDVINEDNDKLIKVLHEHSIHQIHEIGRGIGQSKGHYSELKQPIPRRKSCLGDVFFANLELMVP